VVLTIKIGFIDYAGSIQFTTLYGYLLTTLCLNRKSYINTLCQKDFSHHVTQQVIQCTCMHNAMHRWKFFRNLTVIEVLKVANLIQQKTRTLSDKSAVSR